MKNSPFMTGAPKVNKKYFRYAKKLFFALGSPPHARQYALAQSKLLAIDSSKSILLTDPDPVQQNNAYTPYGDLPPGCAQNLLAYNGEYLEQAGLYLLGHGNRIYSPRLMRFYSPDRIGVFLQRNYNAYAYCKGDPINYSDPSGNVPTLKQLAQQTLISHADKSVAAANITRERYKARTSEIHKLSNELRRINDKKNELAETLSISTRYQNGEIGTQTAGRLLHQLLPYTSEGGPAHQAYLNLSPAKMEEIIGLTVDYASYAYKVHQKIAELLPLQIMELTAFFEALNTAQAAVSAIDRQHWNSAYDSYRIRQ
ncbi:RHS repeat-associated core domain-containing protein [Pseudomonas mosselii]|uniref:RHS repeat-associated core domain-containing protein n=1 Tax=Pseudomonas mosselii TaxID=78327 RepID=UPI000D8C56CE|nr:RHS repeat-associated core domain-containing protein [Pseudomonas mosselii]PYC26871.1 hypothetical protein DMX06_03590 [Pseudomonas mosselii]